MRTVDAFYTKKIGMYDELSKWGHTAIVGKTGYGKGTLGQTLCEQAFEDGKKVFCFDMFRGENTFYGFPEDDDDMMFRIWQKGGSPKAYPTEVLLPVFAREGTKTVELSVPEHWKACKINFKNLTKSELLYLMGKTTEKAEQILDLVDFSQFKNLAEMQIKFLELESGKDKLLLYDGQGNSADVGDKRIYRTINRAIGSLLTKNIVASNLPEGFEYIDLDKIQANPKTITALTGMACGSIENFLTVFFNVMSDLIYDRQKHSGKYAPMVIYIPEVSNIAGATSSDKVLVKLMRFILQESRDAGMEIIIDSLPYEEELIFQDSQGVRFVPIGEIVEKKIEGKVLSFDKNGKVEWKQITDWIKHENKQEVFEVELIGKRKIRCTGSHSIFGIENGEINQLIAKNLKQDDLIIVPKTIPFSLGKLPSKLSSVSNANNLFWLIGFFLAEGYMIEYCRKGTGKTTKHIEVCNCNKKYIEKFREILKNLFGKKVKIYSKKRNPKHSLCHRLVFSDTKLFELFKEIGLNKKSPEREIPKFIFSGSKSNIINFLNGFWCGEGQKSKAYFDVCSSSEKMIDGIGLLIATLGESYTKDIKPDKRGFRTMYSARSRAKVTELGSGKSLISGHELYPYSLFEKFIKDNDLDSFVRYPGTKSVIKNFKLRKFIEKMESIMEFKRARYYEGKRLFKKAKKLLSLGYSYTDIGKMLKHDRCGITRWLKDKTSPEQLRFNYNPNWKRDWQKIMAILDSDLKFEKIRKVKMTGIPKYVYDISVKDNENFLTKDLIFAHNTQRPQNIDASVKGQITKWYVFNLNKDDADYMDKNLVEIPRDYNILYEIPNQGIGVCVKLWQDSAYRWRFRKAAFIKPPASHKKKAYENINKYNEGVGRVLKQVIDQTGHSITVGFETSERKVKPAVEGGSWEDRI